MNFKVLGAVILFGCLTREREFIRKYNGTGCPKAHLKYYLRRMAHYSDNIPLLVNTFQESLAGAALAWFTELDVEDLKDWDKLADEFLHQYKFNTHKLPPSLFFLFVFGKPRIVSNTFEQLIYVFSQFLQP